MEIDWSDISARYREIHAVRASGRDVRDRIKPKIFQYDYLCLSTLAADVATLIADVPSYAGGAVALDLGCGKSPYRQLIEIRGFRIQTMDIDRNSNADLCGSVEQTGLPDESLDLVICTQVLEHSLDPGKGLQEIFRILRPGGYLIASAPHIW